MRILKDRVAMVSKEAHDIIVESYKEFQRIKEEAKARGEWAPVLDSNRELYEELKEDIKRRLIKLYD